MLDGAAAIENALQKVGELLEADGHRYHVVIIGGSAVNLLGFVSRATTDVDVLALADRDAAGTLRIRPPDDPLPAPLTRASMTVARDLGLDPHWLNAGPASQWRTGLPPGLAQRVSWLDYGGLQVGLAGEELEAATAWIGTQDSGREFATVVSRVVSHVRTDRTRRG